MKKEEVKLLYNVQKNAQMGMTAIDAITEKIHDKNLAMEVSREYITFSDINNRALQNLSNHNESGFRTSQIQDVMVKSGVQMNTMLDTSTSHLADMLIQGNTKGVTDVCRSMHLYESAGKEAVELAKELSDFEEKSIERLKKYL